MALPTKNGTKSYWIEAADLPLRNHRSSETLPEETDVVIIGSGYTGASTAYFLYKCTKREGTTPRMLMLESQDICGSATGRNGGQLRPHAYSRYIPWKEKFDKDVALKLIEHEMAHLPAFQELLSTIAKEEENQGKIEDDVCFKLGETFDAAMHNDAWLRLKMNYEKMKEDHPDSNIVKSCRLIEDAAKAEELTQIKGAIGAVFHPAGQIWPYKFVHALLDILVKAKKLELYANTTVRKVSDIKAGWITVTTTRGNIRTRAVVHATNRWAGGLLPEFEKLIYPSLATLAAVKPHKKYFKFNHTGAEHWDDRVNDYHVHLPEPYNTIIVGGAKKVLVHDPERCYNNNDTSSNIRGVPEYFGSWAASSVVGLEEQPSGLERAATEGGCWIGVEGTSVDAFPFVGEHPKREGNYVAAGFTGHGMPRILLSTAYITPKILDFLKIKHSTPFKPQTDPKLELPKEVPGPFKLTAERLERLQSFNLETELKAISAKNRTSAERNF